MTDLDALTLTLYGEARGEPIEGLIGVAMVIRNRVQARWRGDTTYDAVVHAPAQFSCWTEEKDQLARAAQLLGSATLPPDLARCQEVAVATLAGTLADNTHSANHYLTAFLYHSQACPSWALGIKPLATLGRQVFLSLG